MKKVMQRQTMDFQFNPRSFDFRQNPYPTYDYLRTHFPIYYRAQQNDWILTRYIEIEEVLKSPHFCRSASLSESSSTVIQKNSLINKLLLKRMESEELIGLWMLMRKPPAHNRIRQVFQSHFGPQQIRRLKTSAQIQTAHLIEVAFAKGSLDVIHDLATPLSLDLSCQTLGILKQHQHPQLPQWIDDLSTMLDLDASRGSKERGLLAISNLANYFKECTTTRYEKTQGQDSLIASLVKAQADNRLSQEEVIANCILLLIAGSATTKHLLSNSILVLLKHPTQLKLLQTTPSLMPAAIAEVLRYECPVQSVSRTASSNTQLANQTIYKGQPVHCIIAAANRDPAKFSNPNEFSITRSHNPHLSFGRGIHTCIGLHLAQSVAEATVSKLIQQIPNLSLATKEIDWENTYITRGLKSLPVTF